MASRSKIVRSFAGGSAARRVVQAVLALTLLALAVLALFVGRPARDAENRVDLDRRPSPGAALTSETTLRNVTKSVVEYTIAPRPGARAPRPRRLAVGAVDRIAADMPFEVSYDNGRRTISSVLHPGRPYSFRYDENDVIRVYPGSHGREGEADLAPYVPTPPPVVERMLELAAVGPKDVVYDLGCGDGRMVITAAKKYRARGVGIDLDEALLAECRAGAKREAVANLVRFLHMDATKARLTEATVVALYLLPESLETLRPLFERDLGPGARIISHNYKIPGWEGRLAGQEVMADETGREHKIYLYRVAAAER